jgi:hypothetical protein
MEALQVTLEEAPFLGVSEKPTESCNEWESQLVSEFTQRLEGFKWVHLVELITYFTIKCPITY